MTQPKVIDNFSLARFDWSFRTAFDEDKRWIKMNHCISRDALAEACYAGLSGTRCGPSKDARSVIGAVAIKHGLCLSDRETVARIKDNPFFLTNLSGPPP